MTEDEMLEKLYQALLERQKRINQILTQKRKENVRQTHKPTPKENLNRFHYVHP